MRKLSRGFCILNWELVNIGKTDELPEHAIRMSWCKVSGCEFSTKSGKLFSSWRGRLQSTSMSTIGWRGHRVRFPPAFQHFSRKYQHPPTNIFDMAPHTPGVLRFGKLSKKPVAPAGYKNKQCRVSYTLPRATGIISLTFKLISFTKVSCQNSFIVFS